LDTTFKAKAHFAVWSRLRISINRSYSRLSREQICTYTHTHTFSCHIRIRILNRYTHIFSVFGFFLNVRVLYIRIGKEGYDQIFKGASKPKFKGSDTLQTCMSYSEERDLNLLEALTGLGSCLFGIWAGLSLLFDLFLRSHSVLQAQVNYIFFIFSLNQSKR
jgi:hypothetical protein